VNAERYVLDKSVVTTAQDASNECLKVCLVFITVCREKHREEVMSMCGDENNNYQKGVNLHSSSYLFRK
jgi:hypothetical protein